MCQSTIDTNSANIRIFTKMESQVPPGTVSQVPGPEVAPDNTMPPPPPPPTLPSTSASADLYRDLAEGFGFESRDPGLLTAQSGNPALRNSGQHESAELPRATAQRNPGTGNQAPRNRTSLFSLPLHVVQQIRQNIQQYAKNMEREE